MNVLVFDIETVPDVDLGKRLLGLSNLNDKEVAEAMFSLAKEGQGRAFLKHHLQKIVAISIVFRHQEKCIVKSLGELESDEYVLIQQFYSGMEKVTPTLVSWNGCGFDLPVLHYRTLYHGITASRYWENGEEDNSFRYNNYLNRYHTRHIDLMDVLAGYQQKANVSLEEIAQMLDLPGKMGMSGEKVWNYYQEGNREIIRQYCETDVLNTYLVFLRFELMRGRIHSIQYENEIHFTKEMLRNSQKPHLQTFLKLWENNLDRV